MTWYESVFLGFLQGATEFLPVSSSGHLVLGQTFLGIQQTGVGFEVAVHVATLFSVVAVYRARIRSLVVGVFRREREHLRFAGLLLLASVPAAVAGVAFGDFLESLFDAPMVAGAALVVTGCFLWTAKRALAREPSALPGLGTAVAMGLAQALAIVPGISRSGATVVVGLWGGIDPREAAAFSFLLSIPAVCGAAVLKLPSALAAGSGVSPGALAIAAVVACVTGVFAIRAFHAMLDSRSFHRFAPYLWVAGGALLWLGGRA